VTLPGAVSETVTEGEQPLIKVKGVKVIGPSGGGLDLEVGSGEYMFKIGN
jgi:hypothetical protein